MQIILLEKVQNLGGLGDTVDVKPGFARNFLIGEEGKLFGSVGAADVAAAITATGTEVERGEVRIAESIRQVGEYTVQVHLHAEVSVDIKLDVQAE